MSTILFAIALAWTCVLPVPAPRNRPPVAVDDVVMIAGYTDYLEIPVFANDYDPEGKPIDVIALGGVDRGKALLLGIGRLARRQTKELGPKDEAMTFEETRTGGLLIGKGGLYGNVIRISPPLTATKDDVDQALEILDRALAAVHEAMA